MSSFEITREQYDELINREQYDELIKRMRKSEKDNDELIKRMRKLEKDNRKMKKQIKNLEGGQEVLENPKQPDGEIDKKVKGPENVKALSVKEMNLFKAKIEEINNTSINNANEIKKNYINKDRKCKSTLIKQIRQFLKAKAPYKKEDIAFYSTIQEEFDEESKEILEVLNPNKIADQNDNNEEESEADSNSNSDSDSDSDSDNKNSESVNPVKPNSDESDSDSDSDSD